MATWNTTATEVTWTAVDDPSVTWVVQLNPTITGGGGAVDSVNGETGVVVLDVDDVDGRDIYRPALVMSPTSVTTFGGSMVNGVSLTIAALSGSVPTGSDILIWNGTNGGAPNGSYTHAGGGTFNYSARQYLNATSFGNGCVQVAGPDYATTGSDGESSLWAIATTNGTDFGLDPLAGQAMRLTRGPATYTANRPVVFDATDGKWLKEGTAIGGDLATAADATSARSVLGLGTSATLNTGTGSGDVILGNDTRLTDARTPNVGGSNDDFMQRKSGSWTNRTIAQVRTDLGIGWVLLHNATLASDLGTSASPLSYDVTGYSLFRMTIYATGTRNSTTESLRVGINADTGNVYSTDTAALTSAWFVASIPGSSTNTDRVGQVSINFGGIASSLKSGRAEATNIGSTASVGAADTDVGLFSTITAAITSIQVYGANAALRTGSRIIIEGLA